MNSSRTVHFARLAPKLVAASLLVLGGCAARAPNFETSDKTPEEKAPSVLVPLAVENESARAAEAPIEKTVRRFFLALATGAMNQIAPLLSPDAMVRRGPSGAPQPAQGELRLVSAAWSVNGTTGSPGSQLQPLGLIETTQIESGEGFFLITVSVDGPSAVQGRWKLRMSGTSDSTTIKEIILPSQR